MSKLYGTVQASGKTPRTTTATKSVTSWVQTEHGRIETVLSADGTYGVYFVPVEYDAGLGEYIAQHQHTVTLMLGNVNERTVWNGTDSVHRDFVSM